MSFTRTVLPSKKTYTNGEKSAAAAVYILWQSREPRCNTGSDEVLRLRAAGPMVRYDGAGADAGKLAQICFIAKPDGSLKIAAFVEQLMTRAEVARLIMREIRQQLNDGATGVYFYKSPADDSNAPEWTTALAGIVEHVSDEFPDFFSITQTTDGVFERWDIRQRAA